MANMVIRKFVISVAGAMEFLEAVGFSCSGDGADACLSMKTVNTRLLDRAVDLLNEKLQELNEETEKRERQRIAYERARAAYDRALTERSLVELCYGGCGTLGDPRTEGFCLDCYDQLYTGELVYFLGGDTPYYRGESDEGAPPGVIYRIGPGPGSSPPSATPRPCMNQCGRVRILFMGMCRECWQERSKSDRVPSWKGKFAMARLKLNAVHRFWKADRLQQKNKKRCWSCRRRVGISSGIECRCGFIFCGEHRYADSHKCTFDHKQYQTQRLREANPTIVKKKFDRIDDA